jgi:twitching motility protein PilU
MSTKERRTFGTENIDVLLKAMVEKDASDLFITVGMPPTLKVNGLIKPLSEWALNAEQVESSVYGIMSDEQTQEFEAMLEANFALNRPGLGRFRVNVFQQQNEIGMVIRRIKLEIPTIEELHLPLQLEELAMAKRGLVLVVGATSSGKSTTLAALIGQRNRNSHGHIVSVEEPIEFIHRHGECIVTQREVGIDTHSYEEALKNTLRQAPDVIMIGEIRTREVMEHALTFAETGHLVLSTLHATNAYQALDRVINFFPEERRSQVLMDLALNLKAVVAQRLIPSVKGKTRCVAVEVMMNTPLVSDLILRGETHLIRDVMTKSNHQGMKTFDQALYELFKAGEISQEDAILYADAPNEVRLMIKLGGDKVDTGELASSMKGVTLTLDEQDDEDDEHVVVQNVRGNSRPLKR